MTCDVPQHGDLDDHHIVPDTWCKKNIKGGLGNSILNRTPLTADTNRRVIKARLPNTYLPELITQSGESTVRGILESHFISPVAFDILLRDPFGPDDFEAFIAERQRTFQDAIETLAALTVRTGGWGRNWAAHARFSVQEYVISRTKSSNSAAARMNHF